MVQLTLKTLQQKTFSVEIELSASVKELKEKIEKEHGSEYPADGQKLIYAGKILQDDTNLNTYDIDSKKFLVIMVTKPKPAQPSSTPPDPTDVAESSSAAAATEESSSSTTTTSTSSSTTTTTTTTTPSSDNTGTSVENAESLVVMGEEFNRMVENIMEMGYERPQVERALRASFNNPYTAVQYLVDGIPSNLEANPTASAPADAPASRRQQGDGAEQEEGDSSAEDQLAFLRSQPHFNQMRQMIRSNPQLLDAFIQQIGLTNPELLSVIQDNQEAFVRMLNEEAEGEGDSTAPASAPTSASPRSGPGQNTIMVSPEDRDAIERLKSLGNFPEDVVIQAYFACEKNENLAAEFLFSQAWD